MPMSLDRSSRSSRRRPSYAGGGSRSIAPRGGRRITSNKTWPWSCTGNSCSTRMNAFGGAMTRFLLTPRLVNSWKAKLPVSWWIHAGFLDRLLQMKTITLKGGGAKVNLKRLCPQSSGTSKTSAMVLMLLFSQRLMRRGT